MNNKHLGSPILKLNKEGTQINGSKDKKIDVNTQGLTLKRYKDSKNTRKRAKKG